MQFVNYTKIAQKAAIQKFDQSKWEAAFALLALMEVPEQYKEIKRLGLMKNLPPTPAPVITVHEPPL